MTKAVALLAFALLCAPATAQTNPFDSYVGYYQTGQNLYAVERDGEHFYIRSPGQADVEIFRQSASVFLAKSLNIRLTFLGDGPADHLVLRQGESELDARRIDDATGKKLEAEMASAQADSDPDVVRARIEKARQAVQGAGQRQP